MTIKSNRTGGKIFKQNLAVIVVGYIIDDIFEVFALLPCPSGIVQTLYCDEQFVQFEFYHFLVRDILLDGLLENIFDNPVYSFLFIGEYPGGQLFCCLNTHKNQFTISIVLFVMFHIGRNQDERIG